MTLPEIPSSVICLQKGIPPPRVSPYVGYTLIYQNHSCLFLVTHSSSHCFDLQQHYQYSGKMLSDPWEEILQKEKLSRR